jgi:hypothetical protein
MTDLSHSDVDAIRPPNPRQTRMALVTLALIAAGSFVWGLGRQVIGPLLAAPPAEDAAPAEIAQAQPLSRTVQPAVQVAAAEPARRAPPKLDVPDPALATPATPAETAAAPLPEPRPAADAPALTPAEPPADATPPEEPPTI